MRTSKTARSSPRPRVVKSAPATRHGLALGIMLWLASLPSWSAGQDDVPADRAPDMVPLGVYLSVEKTLPQGGPQSLLPVGEHVAADAPCPKRDKFARRLR